jgi:hypothetical protein
LPIAYEGEEDTDEGFGGHFDGRESDLDDGKFFLHYYSYIVINNHEFSGYGYSDGVVEDGDDIMDDLYDPFAEPPPVPSLSSTPALSPSPSAAGNHGQHHGTSHSPLPLRISTFCQPSQGRRLQYGWYGFGRTTFSTHKVLIEPINTLIIASPYQLPYLV